MPSALPVTEEQHSNQRTVTLIVDGMCGALGICCLLNCYEISAGWDLAVCALVKTSAEQGPDFCPFTWQ